MSAEFGAALRAARTSAGWSQEYLAAEAGLDRKTVNRIERGLHSTSLDNASALAEALGIKLSVLILAAEDETLRNRIF